MCHVFYPVSSEYIADRIAEKTKAKNTPNAINIWLQLVSVPES